jgi:hypothetical protein
MKPMTEIDDDAPFASASAYASGLAQLAGGEHARLGVEAEQKRRFRLTVETWARAHDLWSLEGQIVATSTEGTVVTAALFDMTEETAVLRGAAAAPATASFTVEPVKRSLASRLRAAFGKKPSKTEDAAFDARFEVHTSDEAAMRQLLGDEAREELLALDVWCKVTYADGRIELRLDTPRLAGVHLLGGIDIIETIARSRVQTAAYR